ncbi:metal ABC transporter substrate-binding protein [Promicromonospora citrea]|uniref:Zinc ABC transporter substrate-binding protein n=1 Tax=Promicromonospora citrea TaxID=43677 RepID=A0A8H9GEV0_9MICO|nr:metal ABC transporter substrate-binding protein [Promicromonospora citrea]NNH52004.1 zinc ABC transporter substrate-binding protein [Promicromonospora citrea]GGM17228.1 zinc ABC transporter substrate-binding protein [Promicromonospora citrea]
MTSTRAAGAALTGLALAGAATLAGCGAQGADGSGGGGGGGQDGVTVLASFYPLQYVAQQVGGDLVTVDNLTPPAAEPHDLELSPAQVREIGTADVVVYLSGFQTAVDEGVEARAPEHVVDAADVAELVEHDEGTDPHFWLDPSRLAAVGQAVADTLAEADPEHADEYAAGALQLGEQLDDLDQEMADGLAACQGATLVTSHTAFGYLADRYALEQVGISSLDPEAEPSPARLREIRDVVEANGVTTLFSETLVSPRVTETLADDLGVRTAVLDPLEGLSEDAASAGDDYVSVMRANLAALEEGLVCA